MYFESLLNCNAENKSKPRRNQFLRERSRYLARVYIDPMRDVFTIREYNKGGTARETSCPFFRRRGFIFFTQNKRRLLLCIVTL